MALVRSKSVDFISQKNVPSTTRLLQEALYALLDGLEKTAFIEALSSYGSHRDIFELVNALRKILNTPVKRQLFPLVRKVIRPEDVEAFDLVTRGVKQSNNMTLPYLYRPHMADVNVLNKYRASQARTNHRNPLIRSWAETTTTANHEKHSGHINSGISQKVGGVSSQNVKHKIQSNRSRHDLDGEVFDIDIGEPDYETAGYGFTIRGGLETGVGVYVSSVDAGSPAQRNGLTTGDLIVEANNISFQDISHEEAARIITAATRLHLTVSRAGRIPGSHVVHEAYSWTDPKGRPVSPPPRDGSGSGLEDEDERRRSATVMLKGSDERKINLVVQKGQGLGVMIRGGKEYDLGIFVSGLDPFSVAENAGLKLGDQILDVNGRSFLDVTHSEAVNYLKMSRHLIITVKDVGKIPFAKTTIDERGWIQSTRVGSYPNSLSLSSRRSVNGSVKDQEVKKKSFSRGVGTQLMLTSSLGKAKQREQIYDQAKLLLNDSEHATLNYYLAEYEKKTINIRGLVHALLELLNTAAKFTLLSEIRATVLARDLDVFDQLVAKKDLEESLHQARQMLAPDVLSVYSYDSDDVIEGDRHKQTMFSHPPLNVSRNPQWMDLLELDDSSPDAEFKNEMIESTRRLSRSTPDLSNYNIDRHLQFQSRIRSRSRSPNSAYHVISSSGATRQMDSKIKGQNFDPEFIKGKNDDPSDDSGVEINGHAQVQTTVGSNHGFLEQLHMYRPVRASMHQKANPRELSGPQKKILNHLQRRNNTSDGRTTTEQRITHKLHTNTKQPSLSVPKVMPQIKSSTEERTSSYIQHVAEIHKEEPRSDLEDNDDISDIIAFELEEDSPEGNPHELTSDPGSGEEISRRSGHKIEHDRARSKSTSTGFYNLHGPDDFKRNEKQSEISKVPLINTDSNLSDTDAAPNINQHNIDVNSKQTTSTLHNHPLQSCTRRDKSPFRRIWSNFRQNSNAPPTSKSVVASKSQTTLIINGQHLTDPVGSQTISAHNHKQQQREKQSKQVRSVSLESHTHSTQITNNNTSDSAGERSETTPTVESTNKISKRAMFTNARKGPSREFSPSKEGGASSSSRYKSPRRDKQISKINVPLIKKDTVLIDKTQPLNNVQSQAGWSNDGVTEDRNFLTVNQSYRAVPVNQKPHAGATNSERANDGDMEFHNRRSNGNDINSTNTMGRNVTSISVGGPSSHGLQSNPIEDIKKKATEKYGEIPLDIVYIYRCKPTLGVAIEGGANTRQPLPKVISVQPGGSAYESGGLKVGHIILEVNGQPAVGLSHMDAARLIAEAFKSRNHDRMELLVTEWSDRLLDTIKVDVGLLKVK